MYFLFRVKLFFEHHYDYKNRTYNINDYTVPRLLLNQEEFTRVFGNVLRVHDILKEKEIYFFDVMGMEHHRKHMDERFQKLLSLPNKNYRHTLKDFINHNKNPNPVIIVITIITISSALEDELD